MQANLPTNYAHDRRAGDAGLDLRADLGLCKDAEIGEGIYPVTTGLTGADLNLEPGHVALVVPRSGLAAKGITVANSPGVIDSGYTGRIVVLLENRSGHTHVVHHGDRIAQLIIVPSLHEQYFGDGDGERGTQGFGSSGTT
ncbi:hypothetical protein HMPREF2998_02960 [Corynebacterium sp. HMSC065A05]|uniref:dUTP diphosphatase n=1 Tax=Corynebacterium sp. HMSC065A05 TaxID=1739502 RepID=UPI0008A215E4|nr:hypothetical protein [Corynebacterium sp. HMSC065A05]OFP17165.1 hypothetical protein HMPREF2998_02960 [Corynebacterium sp. HMSC065A05]